LSAIFWWYVGPPVVASVNPANKKAKREHGDNPGFHKVNPVPKTRARNNPEFHGGDPIPPDQRDKILIK
jgi:hypothetical protein